MHDTPDIQAGPRPCERIAVPQLTPGESLSGVRREGALAVVATLPPGKRSSRKPPEQLGRYRSADCCSGC